MDTLWLRRENDMGWILLHVKILRIRGSSLLPLRHFSVLLELGHFGFSMAFGTPQFLFHESKSLFNPSFLSEDFNFLHFGGGNGK